LALPQQRAFIIKPDGGQNHQLLLANKPRALWHLAELALAYRKIRVISL